MTSKHLILLAVICCLLFGFIYFVSHSSEHKQPRVLKVYGMAQNSPPYDTLGSFCALKVIQIEKDSLRIDTCRATIEQLTSAFDKIKEIENNMIHLVDEFRTENFNADISIPNEKNSILAKLNHITTSKLIEIESEIEAQSLGCDATIGLFIDIKEKETSTLLQIMNPHSCGNSSYKKFVMDIIREIESL